jgi:hypothetical protein
MKKSVFAMALLSGILTLNSCKGDKKTDETTPETTTTTTEATPTETTTPEVVEPKSYTINVAPGTPETILLGKNNEASIKILNLKAIDLSDPEGKSLGIQLSYDMEVTNKNVIGGSSVYLDPTKFRLELDNGTKITYDQYNTVDVTAESTKTSSGNTYKLPPGTKPVALNLFLDETRVSVKLEIK